MKLDGGQNNDLIKIIAGDMQDLDTSRHNYEARAQAFTRGHNIVVTVVLACSIILIVSGLWWMSIFVFWTGILVIYILRMKNLAAVRQISRIDGEIRKKSLYILSTDMHKQN